MFHNGRPHLYASRMRPDQLVYRNGRIEQAQCPDCPAMPSVKRSILYGHGNCPGGGQRIRRDMSEHEWRERYELAVRDAELIHSPDVSDPTWRAVAARIS